MFCKPWLHIHRMFYNISNMLFLNQKVHINIIYETYFFAFEISPERMSPTPIQYLTLPGNVFKVWILHKQSKYTPACKLFP